MGRAVAYLVEDHPENDRAGPVVSPMMRTLGGRYPGDPVTKAVKHQFCEGLQCKGTGNSLARKGSLRQTYESM